MVVVVLFFLVVAAALLGEALGAPARPRAGLLHLLSWTAYGPGACAAERMGKRKNPKTARRPEDL